MPFTVSHAAAAFPLHKWSKARLPLAALMIGSMSPDFAYFQSGAPDRLATHSFAGVFWFCWPISLALWVLFVRVLEQPTVALLPESWHTRFAPSSREMSINSLALASLAVILGAMSHLVWDSFTHRGTAVVDALPPLHALAFHVHGWRIRWFMVLQHLSSLAGLVILAVWAWRLPPGRYPRESLPAVSRATRIGAVAFFLIASSALAITGFVLHSGGWYERPLFHFAIGGMTGAVLAWCAAAVLVRWKNRRS
ncbi:MAG TPA: DUF4184 family protein [Steroidobacteraceae bacterium]|jgi:hypothetical protein|nr:DUF4184 family protein [Steroidobacteraceae bacterium]